jgi:hypothetical protein
MDIVICVGPNDTDVIHRQLEFTMKNIIGYRNIYLVTPNTKLAIPGCITIDESIYPFSKDTVSNYHGKNDRNGWYLQQLLKLYAGLVIPNITERYLVIDADTFFLKPTTFVEDGKSLYNVGYEYHVPYFTHMANLHPDLSKRIEQSGICHHMVFETAYVKDLFSLVESRHNEAFYKVFLRCITDHNGSGASEYEMYLNFMIKFHPSVIKIRTLSFKNSNTLDVNSNYDYISWHWYMR